MYYIKEVQINLRAVFMGIITISRQMGSFGDELAHALSNKLGCLVVDRQYALNNFFENMDEGVRNRLDESPKFFLNKYSSEETYFERITSRISKLADEARSCDKHLIVLGLGGCVLFEGDAWCVNLRVSSNEDKRIERVSKRFNISLDEAAQTVEIGDRKHKRFVSILFGEDLSDSLLYDLVLNTDTLSIDECSALVVALATERFKRAAIHMQTMADSSVDHQTMIHAFKNETEADFARILDMYQIEWMYEPKTFPIEWDAEGNVKMAFSPDFYLPKFDTYLELTTMDQKYITTKNKKARMVRELYPGTNVRIVNKRDFYELVERLRMFNPGATTQDETANRANSNEDNRSKE